MTNRERVIASLHHEQPDRTPYCIGFTQKAHRRMIEHLGPDFDTDLDNCFTSLSCVPWRQWEEVRPDVIRDHFGVEWDRSVDKDIGVVCNQLHHTRQSR